MTQQQQQPPLLMMMVTSAVSRRRYHYYHPHRYYRLAAAITTGVVVLFVLLLLVVVVEPPSFSSLLFRHSHDDDDSVTVAFIGNSVQYYNDFPKLMESISNHRIKEQNSCLHGNADLNIILQLGSGMYRIWSSKEDEDEDDEDDDATTTTTDDDDNDDEANKNEIEDDDTSSTLTMMPDLGACSVHQLLLGYDSKLNEYQEYNETGQVTTNYYDDDDDGSRSYNMMINDGRNPCFEMPEYLDYLNNQFFDGRTSTTDDDDDDAGGRSRSSENDGVQSSSSSQRQKQRPRQKWDYIVLNDNTRTPCCTEQRFTTIQALNDTYVSLFVQTGAIPILLQTHPYWADSWRDMSGLIDIPTFTSMTYSGYQQYKDVLGSQLPISQQPRIAPVGIAHLVIWEENYNMWEELIHYDDVHPSPTGSFLQALIVYGTIFGHLPPAHDILSRTTSHSSSSEYFFRNARRMVPPTSKLKPYPSQDTMIYLYYVAQRVLLKGYLPKSFTKYENYESLDFIPDDSSYSDFHQ